MDTQPITAAQAREMAYKAGAPRRFAEDHFLQRATLRIKAAAEKGLYRIQYFVPPFEIGIPVYDAHAVRNVLGRRLRQDGYICKALGKTGLTVSWRRPGREGPPPIVV